MEKEQKELEVLKQKVLFYMELLRNLIILLITLAGGTVGLFFKLDNPIAIPFVFLGIVLISGVIAGTISISSTLKNLFKELEEWKKK